MLACTKSFQNQLYLTFQSNHIAYKVRLGRCVGRLLTSNSSRSQDSTATTCIPKQEMIAARRLIRGVIFDMDGTLTVPVIDFAEMRCAYNSPYSLL